MCSGFNIVLMNYALPRYISIVPVIKDKAGNINLKDNYRPISLASIISKIVETIMFSHMETHLITQVNQFGFKKNMVHTNVFLY